ncbi:hypothetical protein ACFX1T_044794 [Malus domestica]
MSNASPSLRRRWKLFQMLSSINPSPFAIPAVEFGPDPSSFLFPHPRCRMMVIEGKLKTPKLTVEQRPEKLVTPKRLLRGLTRRRRRSLSCNHCRRLCLLQTVSCVKICNQGIPQDTQQEIQPKSPSPPLSRLSLPCLRSVQGSWVRSLSLPR